MQAKRNDPMQEDSRPLQWSRTRCLVARCARPARAAFCAGLVLFAAFSGCSWIQRSVVNSEAFTSQRQPGTAREGTIRAAYEEPAKSQVVTPEAQQEETSGWELFTAENLSKSFKKSIGRGPNEKYARERFQEGEQLFTAKKYKEAADKYAEAAERWPESSLEEDSLFMQGESHFFNDKYSDASDAYVELMKKYANSRHQDKAVQRQFAIGQYWIKADQSNPDWPITPNLTDKTRPWFDTFGYAVMAYDTVRLNDPRGALADDAVMAVANAFFVKTRYSEADYYYKLIRTDFPKSEHQVQAHLLGLQCKLKVYQGPDYDGKSLIEAEELIDQMLVQFPQELGDEKPRLLTSKAEVRAQRALREWNNAQFYEKNKYYGAAKYYYNELIKEYPGTQFATQAQQRMTEIQGLPDNPPDRFEYLNYVFGEPSGKAGRRR